jgi:hypothetical protein
MGQFEVLEIGDAPGGEVDCVASAAALTQYLPVLHAGGQVFDAGSQPAVFNQVCKVVFGWQCRAGQAAVAAVGEGGDAIGQGDGGFGDDDVVAVARPGFAEVNDPAVEGGDYVDVDRAAVVLTRSGDGLVVYRDEGSVQDQRVVVAELVGVEQFRDRRHHVADGSVCGGLADTDDHRQRAFGQGGAQRGECDQHPVTVGQSWWSPACVAGIGGGDGGGRARFRP